LVKLLKNIVGNKNHTFETNSILGADLILDVFSILIYFTATYLVPTIQVGNA
jgi:hypothetical protein